VKRDLNKLPEEHPPAFREVEQRSQEKRPPEAPMADVPPNAMPQLAVLVAYTADARAAKGDSIDGFIDTLIESTNDSYEDSDIAAELTLAGRQEISYTESGHVTIDIERLANNGDSILDEAHGERDARKADLVVLLVKKADYAGYARDILAEQDTAFAVVDIDYADWYYTFAHELGHLQGARHNPEVDGANTPFAHGHGYQYTAGPSSWRTIMSYNCSSSCVRIPRWSNPNAMHEGVATGTAHMHDNARVLRETADAISRFRE
jgi:hypothetical protein